MIQTIQCSYCGLDGTFAIRLSFEESRYHCNSCHNSKKDTWDDWFCDLNCLFNWLKVNKIEEEGYPCRDCLETGEYDPKKINDPANHLGCYHPTGWAFGFQSNGVCQTCNGTMRVKETIHYNEKYEKIPPPWKNQKPWRNQEIKIEQAEPGNSL